ncbi:MAG TPA: hypothetical protein PK324_21940, partial [Nocardioides sp.]|nr:hypothetical protein [Nocardioides sp.]
MEHAQAPLVTTSDAALADELTRLAAAAGAVITSASTTDAVLRGWTSAPVVLVVLDEFPLASLLDEGDRIDAEQFPNLARLAEDATWFRNASGVSPTTPEAVPP